MILSSVMIPEWVVIAIFTFVIVCTLAGFVKFVQAIAILRKGRPSIDEELLKEQERELENQDDE